MNIGKVETLTGLYELSGGRLLLPESDALEPLSIVLSRDIIEIY